MPPSRARRSRRQRRLRSSILATAGGPPAAPARSPCRAPCSAGVPASHVGNRRLARAYSDSSGSQTLSTRSVNRSPISRSVSVPCRCGIAVDHVAEAEAVVVLAHQPPHAIDAFVERRAPLAELRRGRVACGEPFDNRVGGQLAGLERQQHARRIQRIEKAERVADQHPAVAGDLLRPVRVVLRREIPGDPRARSATRSFTPGQPSTSSS